jgi:hypothetical protein
VLLLLWAGSLVERPICPDALSAAGADRGRRAGRLPDAARLLLLLVGAEDAARGQVALGVTRALAGDMQGGACTGRHKVMLLLLLLLHL